MVTIGLVFVIASRFQYRFDLIANLEETFLERFRVIVMRIEGILRSIETAEPFLDRSKEFFALENAHGYSGAHFCSGVIHSYLFEHIVRIALVFHR